MSYRDPPPVEPLVVVGTAGVQCIDPATGALRWTFPQRHLGAVRCAPSGDAVLVSDGSTVRILGRDDGKLRGTVELWFNVQKLVAHGEFVVLAGVNGAACFRHGTYVWGVRSVKEPSSSWLAPDNVTWWIEDATGKRVTEMPMWAAQGVRGDIAMILGSALAQTDFDG